MGWLSAVGVCQHLHRQMLLLERSRGAGLDKAKEMRKDSRAPHALDRRVREFYKIYIDNFDRGRVAQRASPPAKAAAPRSLYHNDASEATRAAVLEAYAFWGVAASTDKAVADSLAAETLGAYIDGDVGRCGPSAGRMAELLSFSCWVISEGKSSAKAWAMLGGK